MDSGDELDPDHHVARICKPTWVEDGIPGVSAFEMEPGRDHLSVNWLEFLGPNNRDVCLAQVRQAISATGYQLRPSGRLAVLNVGQAKQKVRSSAQIEIRVLYCPEGGNNSHSGIFDYSSEDYQVALDLQTLLAPLDIFPAVLP